MPIGGVSTIGDRSGEGISNDSKPLRNELQTTVFILQIHHDIVWTHMHMLSTRLQIPPLFYVGSTRKPSVDLPYYKIGLAFYLGTMNVVTRGFRGKRERVQQLVNSDVHAWHIGWAHMRRSSRSRDKNRLDAYAGVQSLILQPTT